ncbi:hypothetical protein IscW_ISCW004763 [Ixodes scapularis]|uniref:RRM domain-containing protein n=1 Tax=Ixodes scapularis TaxID=6945 RepID=B7PI15_IXOSC|nr:hypothetical protein IscW_ISCW004763 [Ixodes scapularis]|eukprot:XP_002404130.1 hypothetical protein IscW_ISCW004763 [Ixodes scapularis]
MYLVIDLNHTEKEIRMHSLPPFIPNEEVGKAFASFGKVKSVIRERWRKPSYDGLCTYYFMNKCQ